MKLTRNAPPPSVSARRSISECIAPAKKNEEESGEAPALDPDYLRGSRMVERINGQEAAKGIPIGFEDFGIGVTALQLSFYIGTVNVGH